MLVIVGTIVFESADDISEVRDALVRRAQRSRNDEGCLDYQFSVALDAPNEIRLIEVWESEQTLQAHLDVPDPEFNELVARGSFSSAVVEAHSVSATREMLRR